MSTEIPEKMCWDCCGPTHKIGYRCRECMTRPSPRESPDQIANHPAMHAGKSAMLAGFALMRERLKGATVRQAVRSVMPRFPEIDWERICPNAVITKSTASAEHASHPMNRRRPAHGAADSSASSGANRANRP